MIKKEMETIAGWTVEVDGALSKATKRGVSVSIDFNGDIVIETGGDVLSLSPEVIGRLHELLHDDSGLQLAIDEGLRDEAAGRTRSMTEVNDLIDREWPLSFRSKENQ